MKKYMHTIQDKIAVLIICHKNPEQVKRLLGAMNHPQIDFYLHLDKKMEISEEQLKLLKQKGRICSKRISCYLADWSLCEAELLLLTEAQKIGYRYYILLSGQDYPIKPVRDFVSLLYKTYPKPYIHTIRQTDGNWVKAAFSHTRTYCYSKEIVRRIYRIASSIGINKVRGLNRLLGIVDSVSTFWGPSVYEDLRKHAAVEVYGGSQWWALPDIAVNELLNDIVAHPNVVKWLRCSIAPDETFFQTMVMRTSVANLVDVNRDPVQGEMTYANFVSPRNKVKNCHPYIITEEDWYWLKERPEYFARKFDVDISTKILDVLDREIQ